MKRPEALTRGGVRRRVWGSAGPGWQLPLGGGRTAADAAAGLEGLIQPPGPSPVSVVSDRVGLLGARSAPAGTAGALPEKVAGGRRGAEPPAGRAAFARPPLGNNASSVSSDAYETSGGAPEPRVARRRNLRAVYKADRHRRRLQQLSQRVAPQGSSWAKCGRVPFGRLAIIRDLPAAKNSQYAPLRVFGVVGKFAAFAGLCTCGSPWCVLCGPKIARVRANDLRQLIANVRSAGGDVYLLTCTVPHDQGDALAPMREALSEAWRSVQQGRAWVALKRDIGLVGTIRGDDEPTWGARGWHPHFHVLLITQRPLSAEEQERLSDHVYERWAARVQRHGYRKPSRDRGVVLTVSHQEAYIVKLGLADELASGLYKEPREGRLSPIQLLLRFEVTGDWQYLKRYQEFRAAYHGRRKLTYSRGLRRRYVATPEQSDAEIAALDALVDSDGEPFEYVFDEHETELWNRGFADSPDRQAELLACARRVGEAGVELYLDYIHRSVELARRARLGPYASFEQIRARVHDPPADWERVA